MDFTLTLEHEMVAKMVRDFAEKEEIWRLPLRSTTASRSISPGYSNAWANWASLASVCLCGLAVPEWTISAWGWRARNWSTWTPACA